MSSFVKQKIFLCLSNTLVFLLITIGCQTTKSDLNYFHYVGQTMGTTYSIKVETKTNLYLQLKIDSTLLAVNKIFSTYDSTSMISEINKKKNEICIPDEKNIFNDLMDQASTIYNLTDGYFDPTVFPLVSYWGFGPKNKSIIKTDTNRIEEIKTYVGLDKLIWTNDAKQFCLQKQNAETKLDLNAIAKGKGVDLIAQLLDEYSSNYMVEIGGEVRVKGVNNVNQLWSIAIDKPSSSNDLNKRENHLVVQLNNESMASSGNYRNFYLHEDKLIGHTINPLTGYPEVNDLLGVSVITNNCALADALATGFMAMGFERSFKIAKSNKTIKTCFIKLNKVNEIETITTNWD